MSRIFAVLGLLMVVFSGSGAEAASPFKGVFKGEAASKSFTLSLDLRGDRVNGRLLAEGEGERIVAGRREGAGVFGTLSRPGNAQYFALEMRGEAIELAIIPRNAAGEPDFDAAVRVSLRRFADEPLRFEVERSTPPLLNGTGTIDVVAFLEAYQGWEGPQVAKAVTRLEPYRAKLLSSFGVLQADIMLSACEGGLTELPPVLADKQTLGCPGLVALAAEKGSALDRAGMRQEARKQAGGLIRLIACDRGELPEEMCNDSGVALAEGLRDWTEAGAVIARYAAAPVTAVTP
ncbi:MAG: hypothetical protein HXY22_13520 [Alphaproteobacteria bacterium]|nr:hypothetical protein [Alphaproteobacteria bacterium]